MMNSITDIDIAIKLSSTNDKLFFVDSIKGLIRRYDIEQISLSKLVEELNIIAYKWKYPDYLNKS